MRGEGRLLGSGHGGAFFAVTITGSTTVRLGSQQIARVPDR